MPDDSAGSFQTHAAYLAAFAMLAGRMPLRREAACLSDLATRLRSSTLHATAQRTVSPDKARLRDSLRNAWGSELMLALGARFIDADEVVRLSNNWNVVMNYYVAFHATHAMLAAGGQSSPPEHSGLQRQYCSYWVDRGVDVVPFSLGNGNSGWLNVPSGSQIDPAVHAWETCTSANCLSIASKALTSTRNDKISDALARARREKKRLRDRNWRTEDTARHAAGRRPLVRDFQRGVNLTPSERTAAKSAVRNVGYIDYLYRLRIRSNYEDSSMFTDGPSNEVDSSIVRRDITYLASAYLLSVELLIIQMVGRAWLEGEATRWAAANLPAGTVAGVGLRLPILFP